MSTNRIRISTVSMKEAWTGLPDAATTKSFKSGYVPSRIYGPTRLIRLLYDGAEGAEGFAKKPSNAYGSFWCAEEEIMAIKMRLTLEIERQGRVSPATFRGRMAFTLRDGFRQKLAICHDWSPRLDSFARLTIPHGQMIYGLVGEAAGQPPYSKNFPGYEKAIAPDTMLAGGATQYVIHLGLPANVAARKWIEESPSFNLLPG